MRSKLTFVLHLGYGGNESYIAKLIDYANANTQLSIKIIVDYLGPSEMAQLRCASDVFIQMPVSDALSAAMTEVLYAGNCVIAGAWLPYGIMRRNGLQYVEVEHFDDLPEKLTLAVDRQDSVRQQYAENASRIRSFLFPDTTSNEWIKLFNNIADG